MSESSSVPPQVSFKTFQTVLDRLKDGPIPPRIDRSYWGTFLGGTYGTLLVAAMRFLGLIDESNEPTPLLEELVNGDRAEVLARTVRDAYKPVFDDLPLARATAGQLDAELRKQYGISGDTLSRVRSFFLKACDASGIQLSSYLTVSKRQSNGIRPTTPNKQRQNRHRKQTEQLDTGSGPGSVESGPPDSSTEMAVQLRSGGTIVFRASLPWLQLSPDDRNFVFAVIDKLREYQDGGADLARERQDFDNMPF